MKFYKNESILNFLSKKTIKNFINIHQILIFVLKLN